MFDINTVINTAIANAVNEATRPLVEHIARLQERLAALENSPAISIDTALAETPAGGRILVFGSFHTAAAALSRFGG